jgi:hypothetical protein
LHVLGIVLGRLIHKTVRVHTGLLESFEFEALLFRSLFSELCFTRPAAALANTIEEGKDNDESTNTSSAGIDGNFGRGAQLIELLADAETGLLLFLDNLLDGRVTPGMG